MKVVNFQGTKAITMNNIRQLTKIIDKVSDLIDCEKSFEEVVKSTLMQVLQCKISQYFRHKKFHIKTHFTFRDMRT